MGDYSRLTDRPEKRYSGVLLQQGRVQLDADWNEQAAIVKRRWQVQALDTFGPCAVPKVTTPDAFAISPILGPPLDLDIGSGRLYLDGLLAEHFSNEELPDGSPVTYLNQPFYPDPPALPNSGNGVAYLDVWEREVTYIEDPNLLEKALGGPDTTTRVQTVWQVKVHSTDGVTPECELDWGSLFPPSAGRLSSRAIAPPASDDPCILSPTGGYRGLENRLYRVEIHQGGNLANARFKWSRDNASVVSAVEDIATTGSQSTLTVSRIGRDPILRFQYDDWVEILDDHRELMNESGEIARVAEIHEAQRQLVLNRAIPTAGQRAFGATPAELRDRHTRVRRWNQQRDAGGTVLSDGLVPIVGGWIPLEDGVEVQFNLSGGEFRAGDYWVFTARAADGSVEELDQAPPRGILHHYCSLATLTGLDGLPEVEDCRPLWPPEGCCCTVSVGDRLRSIGDFADIQDAIDALDEGGMICILPGLYELDQTVDILNRKNLTLSGCGPQTRIIGPDGESVFRIENSERIRLEDLDLTSSAVAGAVLVRDCQQFDLEDCRIVDSNDGKNLRVVDSQAIGVFRCWLETNGEWCQILQARDVNIAHNILRGGLWLQDGSARAVVRENDITNERGVGIALGNVADAIELSPSEAGVTTVHIANNLIHGTANSGISTVANPIGQQLGIGDVEYMAIVGNCIIECVREAPNSFYDDEAVGGIVLREVAQIRIHNNYIAENGAEQQVPACGIFVNDCQGLDIENNTIVDNGSVQAPAQTCIDFASMQPVPGDNPRIERGVEFLVRNFEGNPVGQTRVWNIGGFTGLDCNFRTEIQLPFPVTSVSLTLVHSSSPATVVAINADGSQADTAAMSGLQETLTLTGVAIVQVEITAPQNEAALLQFCFGSEVSAYQAGIAALFVTDSPSRLQQDVRVCIDFASMQPVPGDNPRIERGVEFLVRNFEGNPVGQTRVWNIGGFTGLDCNFRTEIQLPFPVTSVSLTLVHSSSPATVVAINADGSQADTAAMSGLQETLTLTGVAIVQVEITAPQNEAALLQFCFGTGVNAYQAAIPAAQIHDNVVVCPRGQALILFGIGPMSVANNSFTSQGLGDQPNPLFQFGRCVFIANLGFSLDLASIILLLALNAGTSGLDKTRFNDTAFGLAADSLTIPSLDAFRPRLGGQVLFHDNQVTLQIAEQTANLTDLPVTLLSLDDVSLQDNQLLIEIPNGFPFTSAVTAAVTTRASSNRFTELPLRTAFSYTSVGLIFSSATDNQSTHCFLTVGGANAIEGDNQSIADALSPRYCEQLKAQLGVQTTNG